MMLPVSKYEEILETVRNIKQETIRVRELASPLLETIISANTSGTTSQHSSQNSFHGGGNNWKSLVHTNNVPDEFLILGDHYKRSASVMDSLLMERQQYDEASGGSLEDFPVGSHLSSTSEPTGSSMYRTGNNNSNSTAMAAGSTWPSEKIANMWHSDPVPLNLITGRRGQRQMLSPNGSITPTDMNSVMSFASSSGAAPLDLVLNENEHSSEAQKRQQQIDVKVDMVYSLLAVLGTNELPDMGETLLALSSSPDSSRAMRQAGCLSVLVQLVHSRGDDDEESNTFREKATQALRNLVQAQTDERLKKKELKVLKLLEEIRAHCNNQPKIHNDNEPTSSNASESPATSDEHPTQSTENIIKLSFDEGYRRTICELGGIYTLARLIEIEHTRHGSTPTSDRCITLRRYAGMALTNLTFGHGHNKSLLSSFSGFMRCLVAQLSSTSEELRQVTASVLRNLSWRADSASRAALREAGAVTALMQAAMRSKKEATLKSILSALWNLSAHCSTNKADICAVPNALAFLVDMLNYRTPSRTLAIIENAGGILRNVSSHIAIRDDYRAVLRERGCLPILLQQLKSPSLTVVSNACGTLWNLSAKCEQDQRALWDMGAAQMLRSLNHSKHVMIATGSRAALKNLLSSRPAHNLFNHMDATVKEMGLPALPTLGARKQKALAKDLDQNLAETCDNIEPTSSPQILSPINSEMGSINRRQQKFSNNEDQIIEALSSLSLNERCSNKVVDDLIRKQERTTYMPMNNKLCEYTFEYEEQDTIEQPVDYSRKYSETKTQIKSEVLSDNKKAATYSDYAETDLDQPTDYSLRYAENDDSDLEDTPPKTNAVGTRTSSEQFYEGQLDTVKTYCTEGTPLNFSTATSMSDLRQIDATIPEKQIEKPEKKIPINIGDNSKQAAENYNYKKMKSGFSSGLMTPEKPVKYCEEGTPRSFSRHSSFSSLNLDDSKGEQSNKLPESNDVTKIELKSETEKQDDIKTEPEINEVLPSGSKVVTFGNVVDCPTTNNATVTGAEETPLMFSRCSSLGSLSSAEQHSIHDDRSSVISDFSRLTSGIVSPSELPDSPTQTVPPSPRHRKAPVDFAALCNQTSATNNNNNNNSVVDRVAAQQPLRSVFEDDVIKFKEVNTPVEFSTNTSLSSLTIDDEPNVNAIQGFVFPSSISDASNTMKLADSNKVATEPSTSKENPKMLATDSLDVDDDDEQAEDDMLAACINIGIQNNRHRQKKQQIGSPKHRSIVPPSTSLKCLGPRTSPHRTGIPIKAPHKVESKLPLPVTMSSRSSAASVVADQGTESDTTRIYYTEDTPAMLSQAGSHTDLSVLSIDSMTNAQKLDLSDDSSNLSGDNESNILAECIQNGMPKAKRQIVQPKIVTTNKSVSGLKHKINKTVSQYAPVAARDEIENYAVEDSPCQFSLRSSLSDLTVDGVPIPKKNQQPPQQSATLSRAESLSSLSVESFGSTENAEQALLEQCISSGMPAKSKNTIDVDNISKNVQGASVALNSGTWTRQSRGPRTSTTATDEIQSPVNNAKNTSTIVRNKNIGYETSPNSIIIENFTSWPQQPSPNKIEKSFEENLLTQDNSKNNLDIVNKCSDLLDGSVEDNNSSLKNRMLDPDAMIESLDRFTAELVSQSSHLQQHNTSRTSEEKMDNNTMQQSHGNSNDTWNEDTSPNDVSFPSISISAPLVASFNSETIDRTNSDNENCAPPASLETTSTMTESTLIAMEATKIANVVQLEAANMQQSITSLDLEHVKPPSVMDSLISLTSSVSDVSQLPIDSPRNSPLAARKRSIPAGLMVRRALSITAAYGVMKSLESLNGDGPNSNSSCSNLDHMKPPSIMGGDFLDLVDMESSMISVASISSDIEDHRIAEQKQPQNHNSITDAIENMGPPSLFQEVTDLCNSTADVITENVYNSENEIFEDCFTHTIEQSAQTLDDVTITEYSDANSITPVQSDFGSSSAESTPKKTRSNLNNRMTPKQRRQLAKERYKTYTVAAEMVIKEANNDSPILTTTESDLKHTESNNNSSNDSNFATAQCTTETGTTTKLTPKERRLLDRERFQTRVIDGTDIPQIQQQSSVESTSASDEQLAQQKPTSRPTSRNAIRQRRLENRDRFRTRTLSSNNASTDGSVDQDDLHLVLAQQANIVLDTLHADELLDCETLSLVSNEDDSEHNSMSSINYRTYHKSWGFNKNLPVVQSDIKPPEKQMPQIESNEEVSNATKIAKPKIVKPGERNVDNNETQIEEEIEQAKAIRGKRKALYSSPNKKQIPTNKFISSKNIKPLRTMTSNLVKNVTTTIKSNTINKLNNTTNKTSKTTTSKIATTKPPISTNKTSNQTMKQSNITKTNNIKQDALKKRSSSNGSIPLNPKPLERQGTFTKDDKKTSSKIPESKIPTNKSRTQNPIQNRNVSSTSRTPSSSNSRSPSADRDFGFRFRRQMHGSSSSQSLQGTTDSQGSPKKRSSIPSMTPRSNSNISITSTESTGVRKPVASRIASLWKKSNSDATTDKKAAPKKPAIPVANVRMRKKNSADSTDSPNEEAKRLSRLGSFIQVEEISVT